MRLSVGFADLVSFTRLSQRLEARELTMLVDRFGRRSSDVIAGGAGRLVKTVGDEVLFVADTPAAARGSAWTWPRRWPRTPSCPTSGSASRPARAHPDGRRFGHTVNLASRLTALAAPGTVLVDSATAAALATDDAFELDAERTRAVRGVGLVRPGVVRRRR